MIFSGCKTTQQTTHDLPELFLDEDPFPSPTYKEKEHPQNELHRLQNANLLSDSITIIDCDGQELKIKRTLEPTLVKVFERDAVEDGTYVRIPVSLADTVYLRNVVKKNGQIIDIENDKKCDSLELVFERKF